MTVSETHELEVTRSVNFDEIRNWITEDGGAPREITPATVKEFLQSDVDGFHLEPDDYTDCKNADVYGTCIEQLGWEGQEQEWV